MEMTSNRTTGLRVLELGHMVAGPFTEQILAALGADVIKIEPLSGDMLRPQAANFESANRGKRSIAMDMKSEDGKAVLDRALAWANVVQHNFRPGVAERLGVDADTLHRAKPELIVLQGSAYGHEGPKAKLPGFNLVAEASAGHLVQGAGVGNPPRANRVMQVDFGTGMIGAVAVKAAELRRLRSGKGTGAYVSLYGTAIYFLSEVVQDTDGTLKGIDVLDETASGFSPAESIYQASDGWVAIAALGDRAARALARALGINDLPADVATWAEPERRSIADAVGRRSSAQVLKELHDHGVWAEICVSDPEAVVEDAVLQARGSVYPPTEDEVSAAVGLGLSVPDRGHPTTLGVPPLLGEHTRELLRLWGFDETEIAQLLANGTVRESAATPEPVSTE